MSCLKLYDNDGGHSLEIGYDANDGGGKAVFAIKGEDAADAFRQDCAISIHPGAIPEIVEYLQRVLNRHKGTRINSDLK